MAMKVILPFIHLQTKHPHYIVLLSCMKFLSKLKVVILSNQTNTTSTHFQHNGDAILIKDTHFLIEVAICD